MSTKVYDAYRLPEHTDVLALPTQLSAAILPSRLRADAQAIYDCTIRNADRYSAHRELVPPYQPEWPWDGAIQILAQAERNKSRNSTFHDRHRFSVRLLRDPVDDRILALVDMPEPVIRDAFENFAAEHGWADWHYQNQSDRPREIPQTEWDERRQSWDRAFFNAQGTEDAELRIRVAPMLSYSTAPSVMGIGDDEEAALASITPATTASRLFRLLLEARSTEHRGETDDLIRAHFFDRDALVSAIRAEHPLWLELLEHMPAVTIDRLCQPNYNEPVITHPFQENQLRSAANKLIASSDSETDS